MNKIAALILIAAAALLGTAAAYKPIIMLHGYTGSYKDYDLFISYVQKYHPGRRHTPSRWTTVSSPRKTSGSRWMTLLLQ